MITDVNVKRIQAARAQTGKSSGEIVPQDFALRPLSSPASWWAQFKERYFKWERLTVAGKVIEKGWVMPQALGIALILTMLSCTGVLYWRIIDKQADQDKTWNDRFDKQNELLIRMDQTIIMKTQQDNEKQRKQQEENELQDLKIQQLKDQILVMKR